MPHYNIELRNGTRVWDTFEVERGDVHGLRIEVARFVGELLKDHAKEIWTDEEWQVDVTDDNGLILFVLNLSATDSPALLSPRR